VAAICWRCVEDEYLKEIVRTKGRTDLCSECQSDAENAFTADDLAEVLDPIIRENFNLGEDVKRFGEDDSEWWEQEGDPMSDHLQEVIGQYLGWEDEIVDALMDSEEVDRRDGEEGFYDRTQNYVPTPVRAHELQMEWDDLSEDLKHRNRFFNLSASNFFLRLFEDVETRRWWNSEVRKNEHVVYEMPQDTELFRARICDFSNAVTETFREPLKNVGPPPTELARAGRMNADGVAVFYAALDLETCLAETRPALANEVAVISVKTTEPLHILDFVRLGDSNKSLSYFQPDFDQQVQRGLFLRRLQRLISQPIIPGRESEYLITQTMAEYLRSVHTPPCRGVVFQAAQRLNGINVVLFPDWKGEFPVQYVDGSIALYSIDSIDYKHRKRYVQIDDSETWMHEDLDYD
jgi:hypothetical protein